MAPSDLGKEVIEKAIGNAYKLFQQNSPREDLGGVEGLVTVLHEDGDLILEVQAGVSDGTLELAMAEMAKLTGNKNPVKSHLYGTRRYTYISAE